MRSMIINIEEAHIALITSRWDRDQGADSSPKLFGEVPKLHD